MASGMEALFNTLLKSMGFNPAELMKAMGDFMANINRTLLEFDRRMSAIEELLAEIRTHQMNEGNNVTGPTIDGKPVTTDAGTDNRPRLISSS